jgi:putative transposase
MYPIRRRKNSLRLSGYDYSQLGAYFVTMCTKDRHPLFGAIENGMMRLTEAGEIAAECWKRIPEHFSNTKLDEFIVMPDHLHGIIVVTGQTKSMTGFVPGGAIQESPRLDRDDPVWRRRMLLPKIIGRFKQNSAKQINILRGTPGIPVWQRGYHDRIIRDAESLSIIRRYIIANPRHWNSL